MLNCKNCGAPLSLNDAFCPHCGTPNPEAQEHIRKLQTLDHEFQMAQDEVHLEVKKSRKGYGVLVSLVMVLLANLILIPFHLASYDIADSIRISRMGDEEIQHTLDTLLENGEFAELYIFTNKYDLPYSKYAEYNRVAYLGSSYVNLIENLTNYLYNRNNYTDPLVQVCRNITEFKSEYRYYLKWAEDEKLIPYANRLNSDFNAVAKEYLNLTDEDLLEAENMTDSALLVRVNERLNDEKAKQ